MSSKKPPSGTTSQLTKVTREIDQLKFKVDDLCANELPNLGVASSDRLTILNVAKDLYNEVGLINKKLKTLTSADEHMVTSLFEKQKSQEVQRILKLQEKLNSIIDQLEPDKIEEDYFRGLSPQQKIKLKMRNEVVSTEDEDDENFSENPKSNVNDDIASDDDDDDDDDHDDDNDKNNGDEAEEDIIEEEDDDGDDNDDDDDEDEDEDNDEEEDTEIGKQKIVISSTKKNYVYCVEALSNFQAEEDGDLSFLKGDILYITKANEDGWWQGRNNKGATGLIPSTLVKVVEDNVRTKNKALNSSTKRSGKELWNNTLKKNSSPAKIGVTDVLKAMKAVPSGFRNSTLGKLYKQDVNRASYWVHPKASNSNVQFIDLFWDSVNEQLRSQSVSICRTISLVSARSIPLPGAGINVLSRHVFIALWDSKKILSNIHVVRGMPINLGDSWTFTPKVTKMVPTLYDGEIIVRTNFQNKDVCILFELNYTYIRMSTGEVSDISCGWASLPLFDEVGAPTANKNFELILKGGTPFEKGVVLDMTLSLNSNQSFLQNLIRINSQPRIIVKTTTFNKLDKETYDLLPDTLVTCRKYSRFIGLYRHHAAVLLCKDEHISADLICDPLLSHFPRALDYSDLLDALLMTWNEKCRTSLKRSQRKDINYLHSLFKQCFSESIYALLQTSHLPPNDWANENVENARYAFILEFLQRKNPLGNLLCSDLSFKPLNINKLKFDVISKHAARRPSIGSSDIT